MSLFTAEIQRITHRRAAKAAVVIAGIGIVASGALTFAIHSNAAPDLAEARALADQNTADCLASFAQDSGGMSATEIEQNCASDPAWFVTDRNFYLQSMLTGGGGNQPFDQARSEAFLRTPVPEIGEVSNAYGFSSTLAGFGILIALGAGMLGATLIGADWRSGVIESQLVRQPERARLFSAKFAAIAATTSIFGACVAGLLVAAALPAALWRGSTANTGPEFWLEIVTMAGRIGLVAAVLALIGAAAAMIARNTAAGVGFVLFAFIAGGIMGRFEGRWTPYLAFPQNVDAWITKGDVPWTLVHEANGQSSWYELMGFGWFGAGVLLVTAMAAMVAISGGEFQRRDV